MIKIDLKLTGPLSSIGVRILGNYKRPKMNPGGTFLFCLRSDMIITNRMSFVAFISANAGGFIAGTFTLASTITIICESRLGRRMDQLEKKMKGEMGKMRGEMGQMNEDMIRKVDQTLIMWQLWQLQLNRTILDAQTGG